MMGFSYLRNYNYPYIARSITEFWRRLHISLSTFFRDYLYIPLGGSRCSRARWMFNLMVVWAVTGLWHGAAWNYVLWGLYYGILLVCEKLVWGKAQQCAPRIVGHLYTVAVFVFGWSFFWITDPTQLVPYWRAMLGTFSSSRVYSSNTKAARNFSDLLNSLALQHPATSFVYDILRTPNESEYNPTYAYESNTYSRIWYEENIIDSLTAPNITPIYDAVKSFDECRDLWRTTDRHWILERALRSYNMIADALDLDEYEYKNPFLLQGSGMDRQTAGEGTSTTQAVFTTWQPISATLDGLTPRESPWGIADAIC